MKKILASSIFITAFLYTAVAKEANQPPVAKKIPRMYWEPAKYVAKLRVKKSDKNVLLLKTAIEAGGHGGQSGRYDSLRDDAFDYAFILTRVGIKD